MNITNYFISDEFMNALRPLKTIFNEKTTNENVRIIEEVIEMALIYSILFSENNYFSTKGLTEFVENVINDRISVYLKEDVSFIPLNFRLFINPLLKKFGLTKDDLDNSKTLLELTPYITRKLASQKFKYHAFNSTFYESIRENGINPNIMFTSQKDIDTINDIFKKHNMKLALGWQKINCEKKVSYSETISNIFYYGVNSPEWFSQFTGQGFEFVPIEKYDKAAFVNGDYVAAKKNLQTLMSEKNFSREESETVLKFFEINWNRYANKSSMLAVIPGNFDSTLEKRMIQFIDPIHDDIESIFRLCYDLGGINEQTSSTIDTKDAIYIEFPKFSKIMDFLNDRINFPDKKNEQLKEDCIQDKAKFFDQSEIMVENDNSSQPTYVIKNGEDLLKEDNIQDKIEFLSQAKIMVRVDENGQPTYVSQNGEQELRRVNEILNDNSVFVAIVSDKFEKCKFMKGWLKHFSSEIINRPENIQLLALNSPINFNIVSKENRNNVELMRKCASIKGINPELLFYVGKNVQNDLEFFSNLLSNSCDDIACLVGISSTDDKKSTLRCADSIGKDVKTNPIFWILLNSKIISINRKNNKHIPLFSIGNEIVNANMNLGNSKKI